MIPNTPLKRHKTHQVDVRWKEHVVSIGGGAPVLVQSMTNTDTADALNTALQIKALYLAGSEMVRITVNNDASAEAVPYIREQLDKMCSSEFRHVYSLLCKTRICMNLE